MSDQKPGVLLSNETSLQIDWDKLASSFLKVLEGGAKAAIGDLTGLLQSAASLFESKDLVSVHIPIGARALELIVLSFAWSVDRVTADHETEKERIRNAARTSIAALKSACEGGKLSIPFDFFEDPSRSEPFIVLRDEFVAAKARIVPMSEERADQFKLDVAFRLAVWEQWTNGVGQFEGLARTLANPLALAADFDRQWRTYRGVLINEFHLAPVFGQFETKVSLGQLHVPLRGKWAEKEVLDVESPLFSKRNDITVNVWHVRSLDQELQEWLNNGVEDDWLRLIGGGPGSGKSTTAKAFAASIAMRQEFRPLFIPLQRLPNDARLRDAINAYFSNRSGSPFQSGPLERKHVEQGIPLILIFDGLDEIARPGSSADEIAKDTIERIRDLHTELTGETGIQHRVLVTGRMPSFQAARKRADRRGNEALEVVDFLPVKADPLDGSEIRGDPGLLDTDQREQWWAQYAFALNRPTDLPEGLRESRLQALTAEPLLCYLMALSGYLESDAVEAANNRNKVYERLLADVWKRGWGGGRAGKGKGLTEADFNLLVESMALAAWHGGDERVATFDNFVGALKVTRAEEVFKQFQADEGDDVSNLAVNFYLKHSENDAKGFEFTHKSFGEYLAARALIRIAEEIGEQSERRLDVALADWLHMVKDGVLSFELLSFMRDEARLRNPEWLVPLKNNLTRILSEVIATGFPAHTLRTETWRDAEIRQKKAETILLAIINSLASAIGNDDPEAAMVKVDWRGDKFALGNLLHRVRGVRNRDVPVMETFSYLNAPGAYLLGQELISINFYRSNLREATLHSANVSRANLDSANLEQASLSAAIAHAISGRSVNLSGANLNGADFTNAELLNADLTGADLIDVDFTDVRPSEQVAEFTKSAGDATPEGNQTPRVSSYERPRIRRVRNILGRPEDK